MLDEHNMADCKPHTTPRAQAKSTNDAPAATSESHRHVRVSVLTVAANWLSITTRPDITPAVSLLAANARDPTITTAEHAKRLLRYLRHGLQSRPRLGLRYSRGHFGSAEEMLTLRAYSDSDHARDATRLSGTVIYICGASLYWRSALQKTIALHSTSAEIVPLVDTVKKVL
mmetsp:Transcript_10119/g.33096  ORF Transcript_10119/g.33096 Transcript_10119/m.33096 type:complete len:172 (-) Transcript_10119:892-1407(-)